MLELKKLNNALKNLSENMSDFLIGAISLDDLKPIDERIRNARESLKHLNARLILFKAQKEFYTSNEEVVDDANNTITKLHDATANALINNAAIKLALHSYSSQTMLAGNVEDHDLYKKLNRYMNKLFILNDSILDIQGEIEEALQERLRLATHWRNKILHYNMFVQEQKENMSRKLEETNPVLAKNKKKATKELRAVNTVKKLIVNLIAASNHMIPKYPILIEMLEKHRNVVTIEQILQMCHNQTTNETVSERSITQTKENI